MTRNFFRIQDLRFAGICHLIGLLFVVVHYIPPTPAAAAAVSSESNGIAHDARLLHDINGDGLMQAKSERTRLTREAVLPLGHRYIGLGKRLETDDDEDRIAREADKRRYLLNEGNAMRFTGLGKRGGHSGLRFIGLGKRNPAAMRFIGLGKRIPGYGDDDGLLDLDSDEIEDVNGSQDYYSVQDRNSKK